MHSVNTTIVFVSLINSSVIVNTLLDNCEKQTINIIIDHLVSEPSYMTQVIGIHTNTCTTNIIIKTSVSFITSILFP